MKRYLDRELALILPQITGLRAVVLSATPDGLIAWCWSCDDKPEIALGFAALERAATVCLEGLSASQQPRSLMLTAKNAWVASWPLYDLKEATRSNERLVITTVFAGKLQSGMIMLYGGRVRLHMRAALDRARAQAIAELRSTLVRLMLEADDPTALLDSIARDADLSARRLGRLEQLSVAERQRLAQAIECRTQFPTHQLRQ